MPFRSEKQRRFLWAKHPEIAKRWAHEYPNQKNLPTYASDSDAKDEPVSKSAAAQALQSIVVNMLNSGGKSIFNDSCDSTTKKSNSKLEQIQMPQDEKPTYAGEKHINSILKPEAEDEGSIGEERSDKSPEIPTNNAENPLLSKLAVVLAPKIQQELENRRAEQEARMAKRIPNNANVKQYPVQSNVIPPPMGMTAPPQQAQPQQAQPQAPAQQPGQMAPVGGGNSPNANPINSFGGLSMNGDINGNAAFGTPNAAGGEKLGAQKCSCGCGDTTKTCKCPPSCSCRKEGGSCYGLTMKKAYHEALAKITGIGHQIHLDQDEQDELDDALAAKTAGKLGLWDRIRMKRRRGEKPAKPGDKDYPDSKSWQKVTSISEKQSGTPAWQRSAGKNEEGGLNAKGRASYKAETGGTLKPPVTESNPKGERAKRQNSFCSRMCGMKRVNTGAKTKSDPDSRINKSLRKWNCKCSSASEFGEKVALQIERGGLPSRATASTLGHLGGFPMITLMSTKNHVNPTDWEGAGGDILSPEISKKDERAQKLKAFAEKMEGVNPQELNDHRIVLGGTRITRDIPRILMNPRTSLLGKALGVGTYPAMALVTNLTRGSNYNPFSDTTHLYGDSPAVLSHELGHAIDFNERPVPQYSDKEFKPLTWLKRQGRGLMRDTYTLSRALTPMMLWQEYAANAKSEKNLRKAFKQDAHGLNEIFDERQRELPVGMGSYLGATAAPFLGPLGGVAPLAGALGGRAYGQGEATRMKGRWARDKKEERDDEPDTIPFKKKDDKKDDKKEEKSHRKAAGAFTFGQRLAHSL